MRPRAPGRLVPLDLAVAPISAGDFAIQNWMPALLTRRFGFSPGESTDRSALVSFCNVIMGLTVFNVDRPQYCRAYQEGAAAT